MGRSKKYKIGIVTPLLRKRGSWLTSLLRLNEQGKFSEECSSVFAYIQAALIESCFLSSSLEGGIHPKLLPLRQFLACFMEDNGKENYSLDLASWPIYYPNKDKVDKEAVVRWRGAVGVKPGRPDSLYDNC